MRGQIRGLNQASSNAQADIVFAQTGTGTDPLTVTKSESGQLTVSFGTDKITLEGLQEALAKHGVKVEATDADANVVLTGVALGTGANKVGEFN